MLGAFAAATQGLKGEPTPAAITQAIKTMPWTEIPGTGGLHFRCNGKADPAQPAVCTSATNAATLGKDGDTFILPVLDSGTGDITADAAGLVSRLSAIPFEQIGQKVQAGVGRRVDLEQAAGRLALAETNLITDTSNLHDVSARYARLTGTQPPAQLSDVPSMKDALPANPDLIKNAVAHNPAYLSTLASVRSATSRWAISRARAI